MTYEQRGLSTEDLARTKERSDDRAATARPSGPAPGAAGNGNAERTVLFADNEAERLRTQWSDIQATFVDTPRQAVERADGLVAEVMKRMAEGFAGERSNLEHQWDRGDEVTTEDLRIALQRYRAFFDRLLSV